MRTGLLILILVTITLPVLAQEIKGNLDVQSTPPMAAVYINGEYAGTTPLSLTVDVGSYKIRIVKEGYYEFVKDIEVKANKTTYINATLTPIQLTSTTPIGKFRMAPVVKIRPVNDVITRDNPGLIEFYFSNPTVNDVVLTADVYVSVPAGVHVSGEGFSTGGAAGTVHGHFVVPPGSDRTVYMNVVGEKVGQHIIHAEVIYYPGDNKDDYQQISLTHPFTIKEPVKHSVIANKLQQPVNPMWIILIAVVLGGIAIIFAVRRKPPTIKIEEE